MFILCYISILKFEIFKIWLFDNKTFKIDFVNKFIKGIFIAYVTSYAYINDMHIIIM